MKLLLNIDLPEGATKSDARGYVLDAIATHGGAFEPPNEDNEWTGHPFFGGIEAKCRFVKD